MKTIISILVFTATLISCNKTEKHQERFKFFDADTNLEIKDPNFMLKRMKEKKVWRLDLTTKECQPYPFEK
ncbi:hypothetical protein [Chryseobacterium mucoviscidosis]|uniref:hypothetical protein n=1 Tax=Chryseobacterium mucoviscidosis TaxID=1945581 RepID=UPI0030161F4F